MSQEHQESHASSCAAQGNTAKLYPRLRIGFAGARNLCGCPEEEPHVSGCRLAEIKGWLNEALDEVWACSAQALPDHPLRLVCGMAHGADRVAVDSFFNWRGKDAHELLAVFPCPQQDFRDHSGVNDPDAFDTQRERIQSDKTRYGELVLDGDIRPNPTSDPELNYAAECAHIYQSAVVVRQCDVLVALIDRRRSGKPGGTRTAIEEALSFEKPVLVVDHCAKHVFVLSHRDRLRPAYAPATPGEYKVHWQQCIVAELLPVLRGVAGQECGVSDGISSRLPPSDVLQEMDEYFPKVDAAESALVRGWGDFYRIVSERNSFGKIEAESGSAVLWRIVRALFAVFVPPKPSEPKKQKCSALDDDDKLDYVRALAPLMGDVSRRHKDAMAAYRGRFVANYLLGLCAVSIALGTAFLMKLEWPVSGYGLLLVLLYVALCKWLVVEAIAVGAHRAKHARVSETAVSLRYQIERYRAMEPLFFAGVAAMRLPRPSARRGQQFDIAEDLMRLVPISDLQSRNKGEVLDRLHRLMLKQLRYHRKKYVEMRVLHMRLERAVELCGRAILTVLAIDILFIYVKIILKWVGPVPGSFWHEVGLASGAAGFFLVLATAFIPALMATLNAILFQSAAEQLFQRHRAMVGTLRNLLVRLHPLKQAVKRGSPYASINYDILQLAEKTAEAMSEEVAEWAALYLQSVKET